MPLKLFNKSFIYKLKKNQKKFMVTNFKQILIIGLLSLVFSNADAQVKILFDNVKGETSGTTADWCVDADLHDINWGTSGSAYTGGTHSDPQQIPTPAQSGINASTPETYWEGALSYWGIDLVNQGFTVESLPYTGSITYGNSSNAQDLSHYKVFIMCEPNTHLTSAEKQALVQFVLNGGGLYMISDHNGSDRNFDGWDSPHIWMDFAATTGNVFGIIADTVNISPTTTTLPNLPNDSCLHGPLGAVTGIKYHSGTTFTIYPSVNPTVVGIAYSTGTTGNTNVLAGHARYGRGKVAFLGDSSPCDDGTGNPNSTLVNSYTADLSGSHRKLLVNTTVWLAAQDSASASGTLSVSATGSSTICDGQSVTLNASGGTSYSWSPGGATTASITVSPTTSTTYTVTGIVNGSSQNQTIAVTVNNKPTPAFTFNVTGMNASFANQSQNATNSTWNFGDGSAQVSSSTPLHIYPHNGTFTVLLITTNGCGSDTLSKQVTINYNGINDVAQDNTVKIIQVNQYELKVLFPDNYSMDKDIYVYSMTGQEVLSLKADSEQNSRLVNIQNLSSGVYFLRTGETVKKFVK